MSKDYSNNKEEIVCIKGKLSQIHGMLGSKNWGLPHRVIESDVDARPGYETCKSHEYYDQPDVLLKKVKLLAKLLRKSRACIAYTGAGISTAAGIGDYASRNTGEKSLSVNKKIKLKNLKSAKPTYSHHVLTSLYKVGILKHWIQQNHDGLPQKAGYPQVEINEIHGAWFDPSNSVVKMSGSLRDDLFDRLIEWEQKADLCLALGTSLCGMNADRVAETPASKAKKLIRARKGDQALGTVIVALQKTRLDNMASLRIFAKIDHVMKLLKEEMQLPDFDINIVNSPKIPKDFIVKDDVFRIKFGQDGLPFRRTSQDLLQPEGKYDMSKTTVLDLRVGKQVKLTGGMYKGDIGTVIGKTKDGHYRIRFSHNVRVKKKKEKVRKFIVRRFGSWWIECGVNGEGVVPNGLFPLISC